MYISKRTLVVGLALAMGLLVGGSLMANDPELAESSTLETILNRGELVVGSDVPFPPFESVNDEGEVVGYDVDMTQLMADELGVELNFTRAGSFDTIIPELNNGDFDIIASAMTRTLQRARDVNFTKGYLETGQVVIVSKQKAPGQNATQYSDLNVEDAVITVQTGTTGESAAQNFFPNAQINSFPNATLALQEVVDGNADAIVFDDTFLIPNFREVGSENVFLCCPVVEQPGSIEEVRPQLNPLTVETLAFAVRKGDPDFLSWLDLFVEQARDSIIVNEDLAEQFDLPDSALGNPILPELQKKWDLR